jgi:hypothetical protein
MPIIAGRASAAYGAGFAAITTPPFQPFGAYDSLATVTLSAATSSIDFVGIPTGYKHLQIRMLTKTSSTGTGGPNLVATFNGDTANGNYRSHYLTANGSSHSAGGVQASGYYLLVGNTLENNASYTSMFGAMVIDILDYANTNKNKTVRSIYGHDRNGSGEVGFNSSLWMNTAAVTSISLSIVGATNFVTDSSFALYGVK